MESYIRISGDFLFLDVKAVPGASKSELVEAKDGRLRVRIAAAPEDGKANEELCSFLAKQLEIPKKDIVVASGEKSRLKTLRLPVSVKEKIEKFELSKKS
jgi:uncharacterized protein (TIGR00251 family)